VGESLAPELITGGVSVVTALIAAWVSYVFGKRAMRDQLPVELEKIRATAQETRDTAAWDYQLQAVRVLREAVGAPKTHIIEATHDLADRLQGFLSRRHDWSWTHGEGYYRYTFVQLLACPLVWMEVLRRTTTYLDRNLGEAAAEEFEFLGYCRDIENAFTDVRLFRDAMYDGAQSTAHLFSGTLRDLTDQLVRSEDSRLRCARYGEFRDVWTEAVPNNKGGPLVDLDGLISDFGNSPNDEPFRIVRLLLIYLRCLALLERYHLPYREYESVDQALTRYLGAFGGELGDVLVRNVTASVGSIGANSATKEGRPDAANAAT
jgi:hypothetical protein